MTHKKGAALAVGSEGCYPGARDERNERATHTRPRSQCAVAVGRRARGRDDDEDRVADAVLDVSPVAPQNDLDAVRNGSKSNRKPPTAIIPGDDLIQPPQTANGPRHAPRGPGRPWPAASRTPSRARAAVATTVVSRRSDDESTDRRRGAGDDPPVAFGRDGGPARYDGARRDV